MSGDRIELRPGELPVEPLPDVSWQRIERKLFVQLAAGPAPAPQRSTRRRWLVAGGALAAAAAAALSFVALAGEEGGGDRRPAPARSPARIATGEAPSALSVGDVALEVAPHTALLADADRERGVLFVLERGQATFRVAPVGARPPVVVQAGDVRVEVIGTAFAVSRQGDSARVAVYEGVVSLVHAGERSRLGPGSVWPAAPSPPAEDRPAADEPAPPPEQPAAPPAERRPPTDRTGRQPALAAPRASDKQRYQSAQALERTDPDRARTIYGQLASGGGVWAPMALYAHALLEERAGHRPAARKLLERYLTRYPDGLNAADARELLKELGTK